MVLCWERHSLHFILKVLVFANLTQYKVENADIYFTKKRFDLCLRSWCQPHIVSDLLTHVFIKSTAPFPLLTSVLSVKCSIRLNQIPFPSLQILGQRVDQSFRFLYTCLPALCVSSSEERGEKWRRTWTFYDPHCCHRFNSDSLLVFFRMI